MSLRKQASLLLAISFVAACSADDLYRQRTALGTDLSPRAKFDSQVAPLAGPGMSNMIQLKLLNIWYGAWLIEMRCPGSFTAAQKDMISQSVVQKEAAFKATLVTQGMPEVESAPRLMALYKDMDADIVDSVQQHGCTNNEDFNFIKTGVEHGMPR